MKYKEVSVGITGVIPIASYENLRPSFTATIEVQDGDNENEVIATGMALVNKHFELVVDKAKVDLIEKQYKNVRFREIGGVKYPSVTSILSWDKDWKISEDELSQYASRGKIVHKLIEIYLKTKKWVEPEDIKEPEIEEAVSILMSGSLKLHWNQCSYKKFFKEYEDGLEVDSIEQVVLNKEVRYSGQYDIKGKFQGKSSIIDCKTGSYDMAQLAAYAVCERGIEQLIVFPVGITNNKTGFMKPIVSTDIETEYKRFLYARDKFKRRFGL
jgi:hypothetical protein